MKGLIVKKYLVCALMLIALILMPVFASLAFAPVWLKVLIIVALLALQSALIYYLNVITKKIVKLKEKEIADAKNKQSKKTLLDTYAILGISPQYKSDGTLKSVYELLKINPQYDKNGNRLLTPYELLGINPIFTEQAQEIPYIFRIKNRAKALIKASGSVPLYYIPRTRLAQKEKGAKILPILPVGEITPKAPFASTKVVGKVNKSNAPKPKVKAETPNYGRSTLSLKPEHKPLEIIKNKSKSIAPGSIKAEAQADSGSDKEKAPKEAESAKPTAPTATVTTNKPTAPAAEQEKPEEHTEERKSVDNAVNNDELNNIRIGTAERDSTIENIVIKNDEAEISVINNVVIKAEETHEVRTEVRKIVISGAEKDLTNSDIKNRALNVDGMSRE